MDNILIQTFDRWNKTKFTIDSYVDKLHPVMLLRIEPIKQGVIRLFKDGVKVRTITEITEANISSVKELIRIAGNKGIFRHLDNVTGNFSISDRKIYQAQIMGDLSAPPAYTDNIDNVELDHSTDQIDQTGLTLSLSTTKELPFQKFHKSQKNLEPQSIMSNIKEFVDQQQYIFEMMWNKAIPAKQRIKEIEKNLKREFIETIQDQVEVQSIIDKMLSSATDEIDIVFPTRGSFIKFENDGFFKLLKNKFSENNELQIKIILCDPSMIVDIKNKIYDHPNVIFEVVNKSATSQVVIIMTDKESVIAIEVDDDKNDLENKEYCETGLAIYSNSKYTVLSYDLIFETIWSKIEIRKVIP
jgi:hypothetical protein